MDNKNYKVLLTCLFFRTLTGSELYVFEIAKNLKKLGYDVSVASPNIGGRLTELASEIGIEVRELNSLTPNDKFDLIHSQHTPITEFICNIYPDTPKITTIHSEVISLENPFIHASIKKYVAIRPEIKNYLKENFKIKNEDIEIIYNPIDETKFNTENTKKENHVLFVGTIDYLRKQTIFDLVEYTRKSNKEFWIVGSNHSDYLPQLLFNSHVKYFNSNENVYEYFKNCSETAGILLGRTTIEGWMCGKPGWIYTVDNIGQIINKKLHNPPPDLKKFYASNVIQELNELYKKILI